MKTIALASLTFWLVACGNAADGDADTTDETGILVAEEPRVCPETGTCAEAYGDDRLACFRVGKPPFLCGSKNGSCAPGQGECGPDGACVTGFKEFCPECEHDTQCVEATECGASVPAERCD